MLFGRDSTCSTVMKTEESDSHISIVAARWMLQRMVVRHLLPQAGPSPQESVPTFDMPPAIFGSEVHGSQARSARSDPMEVVPNRQ